METLCSPVLNCEDVRKLIDIRRHLPSRSYVTVKGCIISMSEILRMKHEDFFLLELDCQVYILVKDFHLDWHSQLCPLTTVVFHNLRLTSIEKGVAKSQSILIVWKTSQMTVEPKSKDIAVADFKEWLANSNLVLRMTDPEHEISHSVKSTLKCHHFQGKVTDASQSSVGIFGLNDNISDAWVVALRSNDHKSFLRLFTGFIPFDGFDAGIITEGCTLQVYNVHSLQESENLFVACSRSLIRCNEHSVSEREKKGSCFPSKKKCDGLPVNSFIHKYSLNFNEAQAVLTLKQHLEGSGGKNVTKILNNILKSEVCGNIATVNVSPIDLFIHHYRLCQMSAHDNHISRNRIPSVQSVRQLKDLFWKRDNETTRDRLGPDEWSSQWSFCQHWEDKKILLGTLSVNMFGQLDFVDYTGEIPVVLCSNCINEEKNSPIACPCVDEKNGPEHKRSELTCHRCNINCLRALRLNEKSLCPFISQGMIGKTFIIQRFQLISERIDHLACSQSRLLAGHSFIPEIKLSETNEVLGISPLSYLLIHLRDCLMLENIFNKSSTVVDCESLQSHTSCDQAGPLSRFISHMDDYASCLIHVSGKESVMASAFKGRHFKIHGTLIRVGAWVEFVVENKYLDEPQSTRSSCGDELSENCFQKRMTSADLENFKPPTLEAEVKKFKYSVLYSGSGKVQELKTGDRRQRDENDTSNQNLPQSAIIGINQRAVGSAKNVHSVFHDTQPVTLFISGKAITSHPFLTVNNFYVLKIHVNKEHADFPFKPVFSNGNVEKTLLRSNSRVFIDVNDQLIIKKAVMNANLSEVDAASLGFETGKLLSVVEALKQRDTESVVSFRGLITAREALTPTFSLKGSSSSDDIKLIVRDLKESNFHMHVYFKSFKAGDVLGLIPALSRTTRKCSEYFTRSEGYVLVNFISLKNKSSDFYGKVLTEGLCRKLLEECSFLKSVVADFHGVERKVSQQGNVYCKFGTTASFFLLRSIGDSKSDTWDTSENPRIENLPREYLFNIWHLNANDCIESQVLWSINCHICMIFRLNLKVVCSLCQGLYLKNGCQSRGCKNSDTSHVKAHAVILVDDGTSQASVKFFKLKSVQKLLTLTDEQWSDLISEVQESGEILVSRFDPLVSALPVENFLCQLIQSPLVIRSCCMAVRRMKNSPNGSTVAKMNLQDFKMKDTKFGKSSIPVFQLPLMQLECLDLKEAPR